MSVVRGSACGRARAPAPSFRAGGTPRCSQPTYLCRPMRPRAFYTWNFGTSSVPAGLTLRQPTPEIYGRPKIMIWWQKITRKFEKNRTNVFLVPCHIFHGGSGVSSPVRLRSKNQTSSSYIYGYDKKNVLTSGENYGTLIHKNWNLAVIDRIRPWTTLLNQ